MHFLAQIVEEKQPEILNLSDELQHAEKVDSWIRRIIGYTENTQLSWSISVCKRLAPCGCPLLALTTGQVVVAAHMLCGGARRS
jgi:hypothetical protein